MPVKLDTRKKTRKQKEKNRRRKKTRSRNQKSSKKNEEGIDLSSKKRTKKIKKTMKPKSMKSVRGRVSNSFGLRMPIGSNHLIGPYATASDLNFNSRFRNRMLQARSGFTSGPTYRYPRVQRPIQTIEGEPIGLAQPSRLLHDTLRPLPAESVPRGHRQTLLREARAIPVQTGFAEPGVPDAGSMYEITEELRPRVSRYMTADELRKEDNFRRVQADMRTGNRGPTIGIWAPSRVADRLKSESAHSAHNDHSGSSRESARRDGRRRLSMVEEHAFLKYHPHQIDLVERAKKNTPDGQEMREMIRKMIDLKNIENRENIENRLQI